ncbi:sigma-70 family RNA polymerase sigma factor [Pantoea sp. 1.19]|uniref:sigma-70 family RNA polymerase sigma factor n=1 Tax=Pantoea sp. 1.19 TaxID=1925589 RepID=UPI000948E846|nr:sigma-70 family RNA polymerase sigma factor [Pantoea sp. 1.19]
MTPVNQPQLEALLARSQAGDREAFALLYRVTSPTLFSLAWRMLRDRALAEELLQELYLQLWREPADYDPARASMLTWLSVRLRHRVIDEMRRRKLQPLASDPHDLSEWVGEEDAIADDSAAARLRACLRGLSPEQRQCISLAWYQDLSQREIALHCAQPLGTIKSWIRRALAQLKECTGR